jgi:membrane-associated protein
LTELIRQFWHLISTPEGLQTLIGWGGLPIITLIVFAETGLLIGFFLPGDSLLFIAGFLASPASGRVLSMFWLNVILMAAAIIGDTVGYWIGRRAGPAIFNRPQSRFFRRDHLLAAHAFYEKHGGKTIILARFMPIIRTFAPFVAGVGKMGYQRFFVFNVVGATAWVAAFATGGYVFGGLESVKKNFHLVIIAIVIISVLPGVVEYLRHRNKKD